MVIIFIDIEIKIVGYINVWIILFFIFCVCLIWLVRLDNMRFKWFDSFFVVIIDW